VFHGLALGEELQARQIDTLVLGGIATKIVLEGEGGRDAGGVPRA
jgi:hypothetical protein